ncbi:MAG TPA: YciI family protein [Planctomycetota bacterium]|nr:YciI family protein [Planctomycetota bacterium]
MRFIIMHKTNARWEAGAIPTPELIARVGRLIGDLVAAKVLRGAEGLRPSSQGARLRRSDGKLNVLKGPFKGDHELIAGFSMVQAASLDEAVEWASRWAESLGDVEIDVRPFTEPWDIGMAPKPAGVSTRRYMALLKATAETEAGKPLFPAGRAPATETLRPSRRGRRYKNTGSGITWTDGPFSESKEMVGGYVIVSADSLEDAARWVPRYIEAAEAAEVDLLELEDPS